MSGKANTAGRVDDPDLAPDAALAEDLGDEDERRAQQIAHLGGEIDDDIDNWDPKGLDDGSVIGDPTPPAGEAKQEKDDADDSEDSEEEEEAGVPAGDSDDSDEDSADADDSDAAESEESAEEDGDEDEEPEAEVDQKGIPLYRFNEVNERRKAAERELEELKKQQQASEQAAEEEYDFDKAELEYQDLLLDGDTEGALAKRKEIRAAEHAAWKTEAKTETKQDLSVQQVQDEVTALSKQAESMFPVFEEGHKDFDPAITNKALIYYQGYLATGDDPANAFVTAIADVVEQYRLDERYGVNLDGSESKPAPKPKPKPKKETERKEKLAEQAHTPVGSTGEGSADRGVATPDIMQMTDEDLDRLSEEQLARMRGDYV